ncbi:MAG TPA: FAD-binding oxidoreductase, partial [Polyangiaceae bacterium]
MTTRMTPEVLIPPHRLNRAPLVERRSGAAAGHEPMHQVDVRTLWARLRREVTGEVRFDEASRGLYAQDASNYFHVPLGVVVPRSAEDVVSTLAACREAGAPVVSRGGGTGLAGQTANEAIVIDFSKYFNRILEVDAALRRARVEPGVICDQLVDAARPHGLTWGPKPATHSHCCFGGMLANNCGGMHAQYAGIAVHNVEAMRVVLYDGTVLDVGWMNESDLDRRAGLAGREGEVFAKLRDLRNRHGDLIRARFPKLPRRVSGYNLDELLPDFEGKFNVARALVGTEGTCITMLEATLKLVDDYPEHAVVAMGYEDVYRAGDHVLDVLEFAPLAVEGMDHILYEHVVKKHLPQQKYLGVLPRGKAWLLVQLGSHDRHELH